MNKIHGNSKFNNILTKDFLIKEYITNKKSANQIAKELGCSPAPIYRYLKINKIKPRTKCEAAGFKNKKTLTKKFLIKEYIVNKKSTHQIDKEIGCSFTTVLNYLKKYDIPIRTKCESQVLVNRKGNNHPQYIDGHTTRLHYCIDCEKKGIKTEISRNRGNERCQSCAGKYKWQDPIFRKKHLEIVLGALNLYPNKPEKCLIKLLHQILPKTYKFVGDGKLIVGGFNPDFVNKDNNKIIEMYGDYWHNREDAKKRDKGRLHAYTRNNYETLIIWEHELKNLNEVKKRIEEFHNA